MGEKKNSNFFFFMGGGDDIGQTFIMNWQTDGVQVKQNMSWKSEMI